MGGRGSSTGGAGGSSVAGGGVGSLVGAGGCGSAAGGVSLVLLGDGAYVDWGGSLVADDEGSSCAGVLSVGRVVGVAALLGPELAEDRSGVISLVLPDPGILEPTAVRFSRTSRNTVSPSAPSNAAT